MNLKYTFFLISIELPNKYKISDYLKDELNNSINLVLFLMGANSNDLDNYKLINEDKIVQIFRCGSRKREGQLNKFCEKYLPEDVTFQSKVIKKKDIMELLAKAKTKKNGTNGKMRYII